MRCNVLSFDDVFVLLAEVFGGIAELQTELRSLPEADPDDLKRLWRELNRIEAEACLLRAESLMRVVDRSGH